MNNTKLICNSLNIKPQGSGVVDSACHCGVCGSAIIAGDVVDEMVFPASFTNQKDLVDELAEFRCGYCTSVMTNPEFVRKYSTMVFTKDGAYPIGKKINRAWFLINPPKPPFLMCVQSSKSQHITWRTPVSLSKDVFFVQLGDITLTIRHKVLMDALVVTKKIRDKYCELELSRSLKKKSKAVDRNKLRPLGYPDMKGQSLRIGQLQYWVKKMIEEGDLTPDEIQPLYELNWGEAWALDAASTEGKDAPTKPEKL